MSSQFEVFDATCIAFVGKTVEFPNIKINTGKYLYWTLLLIHRNVEGELDCVCMLDSLAVQD